jgi:hypothetical protein
MREPGDPLCLWRSRNATAFDQLGSAAASPEPGVINVATLSKSEMMTVFAMTPV